MSYPPGISTAVAFTAAQQRPILVTSPILADVSPLLLATALPDSNTFWLASQIVCRGFAATNAPSSILAGGPGEGPASGLFLCPLSDFEETLTQAQVGINLNARAVPLPTRYDRTQNGTGGFWFEMIWDANGSGLVIPQGYIIGAIVCPNPGTATPGPGVGSYGTLTAIVSAQPLAGFTGGGGGGWSPTC